MFHAHVGRDDALVGRDALVVAFGEDGGFVAYAAEGALEDGQVTTSGVVLLPEDQRTTELARMMAGLDTTDSALAHAGELVELAASARSGSR